jgi:glycopeptide antibiotics resistance protein
VAALCYGVALVGTLWPTRAPGGHNVVPFRSQLGNLRLWLHGQARPWALREVAINLALLAPFAVALALGLRLLRGRRGYAAPTVLISAAASAAIEAAQLAIPSRTTDITDVILNTVGAALAVAGVAWWDRRRGDDGNSTTGR